MLTPPDKMKDYVGQFQNFTGPRASVIWNESCPEGTDYSRWSILYPAYIDASKTKDQGRRVPFDCCVEEPSAEEMAWVCSELGLPYVLEDKCYPKDWIIRGRVRVNLVDSDYENKKSLLGLIGPLIMSRENRIQGGEAWGTPGVYKGITQEMMDKKKLAENVRANTGKRLKGKDRKLQKTLQK